MLDSLKMSGRRPNTVIPMNRHNIACQPCPPLTEKPHKFDRISRGHAPLTHLGAMTIDLRELVVAWDIVMQTENENLALGDFGVFVYSSSYARIIHVQMIVHTNVANTMILYLPNLLYHYTY